MDRFVSRVGLLLLLFTCCSITENVYADNGKKKVAVVLSGGGAKGMAHIGVLKVIQKAGIPVDIITGTSMGSIVGGLFSVGWNANELDSLVRGQDWLFILSDRDDYYSQNLLNRERQNTYFISKTLTARKKNILDGGGFIQGKNLSKLFTRLTAGYNDSLDFNKLPIPFACVATNIVDNTEYDFHSGVLADAMRTSMSIPYAFTPIRRDAMMLVDGGLRNNYPADVAKSMGADYIIGSTVQSKPKTADELTTGAAVLTQVIDINCKNKYEDNIAITDIPIRVNTSGYGPASFSNVAIDSLIRRGEDAAMAHWDELMALKRKLGYPDDYMPNYLHASDEAKVPVDFANKTADARPTHDVIQGNLGVRFDTEEMVALQINGVYKSSVKPLDIEATLRLGQRIMANAQAILTPKKNIKIGFGYTFHYDDIDIYNHGDNDYNIKFNHHQVGLNIMGVNIKNLILDLSAHFDYYNYRNMLVAGDAFGRDVILHDDHYVSYHANLHYDSENMGVFPTRGAKFNAEYAYFTDNFTQYDNHLGFSELSAMWRISFALNSRFTLQPMAYGRLLFGRDIPYIRQNVIGGQWFGHYFEQQMPFVGVGNVELTDPHFIAMQLKAQQRLGTNNYILVHVAAAQHADKLRNILDKGPMLGYQLGYYYKTIFGPLGANLEYSNKTNSLHFYINLGFEF